MTITGADGFVGRHLVREAALLGHSVTAVTRTKNLEGAIKPFVDRHLYADLSKVWPEEEDSDAVIHLAGLADVGRSFSEPLNYMTTNSAFAVHIGESFLKQQRFDTRVLFISTGAVYKAQGDAPITEKFATSASSPYAASKLGYEQLANYYSSLGIDAVTARPFNHLGPGQKAGFILPDLAIKIHGLAKNQPLELGNISTSRDYTDVRDVANAYIQIVTAPKLEHKVYNVASGTGTSGFQIFNLLWRELGNSLNMPEFHQTRIRPLDNPKIIGDATRLTNELGWKPRISLEESIHDFCINLTV